MKWFAGAVGLLLAALALGLGLMAYAIYALLGVMIVSRLLSRAWSESLSASRECNRFSVQQGDKVAVVITLENRGALPIAWLLLEDLLPIRALVGDPPALGDPRMVAVVANNPPMRHVDLLAQEPQAAVQVFSDPLHRFHRPEIWCRLQLFLDPSGDQVAQHKQDPFADAR